MPHNFWSIPDARAASARLPKPVTERSPLKALSPEPLHTGPPALMAPRLTADPARVSSKRFVYHLNAPLITLRRLSSGHLMLLNCRKLVCLCCHMT